MRLSQSTRCLCGTPRTQGVSLFVTLENDWRLPMSFTEAAHAPLAGLGTIAAAAAALRTRSDASAVSEKSDLSTRARGVVASSRVSSGICASPAFAASDFAAAVQPGRGAAKPPESLGDSQGEDPGTSPHADPKEVAALAALEPCWPQPGSPSLDPGPDPQGSGPWNAGTEPLPLGAKTPDRPPDAPCLGGRSRADSGSGPIEAVPGAAGQQRRRPAQGCARCAIC